MLLTKLPVTRRATTHYVIRSDAHKQHDYHPLLTTPRLTTRYPQQAPEDSRNIHPSIAEGASINSQSSYCTLPKNVDIDKRFFCQPKYLESAEAKSTMSSVSTSTSVDFFLKSNADKGSAFSSKPPDWLLPFSVDEQHPIKNIPPTRSPYGTEQLSHECDSMVARGPSDLCASQRRLSGTPLSTVQHSRVPERRLSMVQSRPVVQRRLSTTIVFGSKEQHEDVPGLNRVHIDLNDDANYAPTQGFYDRQSKQTVSSHKGIGNMVHQRRISISGDLSYTRQNNFENKLQRVVNCTGKSHNYTLQSLGIGFMCKKGLKPDSPNQDDFFIARFANWGLYGVFDGHGMNGHQVANKVQTDCMAYLTQEFPRQKHYPTLLKKAFAYAEQMLEEHAAANRLFDCSRSGTTATVVLHLIDKRKLYIAHVGDSRCVLGRLRRCKRKPEALALTEDHKPNLPHEYERIIAAGGHVERLEGDIPYRVFVKGRLFPGLAMSRALGDTLGRAIGISCEPQIVEHTIDPNRDICLCLSSDGVWEFVSSEEVIKLVLDHGPHNVQKAAETIAKESWKRWLREEGNVVDDITTTIIYLNKHLAA